MYGINTVHTQLGGWIWVIVDVAFKEWGIPIALWLGRLGLSMQLLNVDDSSV